MTCSNCGQPSETTAVFCPECGVRLKAVPAPPTAPPRVPPVRRERRGDKLVKNLGLGCVGVLGLFLVLVVVAALLGGDGTKKVPTAATAEKPPAASQEPPERKEREATPDAQAEASQPEGKPGTPGSGADGVFGKGALSSILGRNVQLVTTDVATGSQEEVTLTKTGYLKTAVHQGQLERFASLYAECVGFEVRLLTYLPKQRSVVCSATGDFEAKAFVSVKEPFVPVQVKEGDLFFMEGREDIGYRYYRLQEKR